MFCIDIKLYTSWLIYTTMLEFYSKQVLNTNNQDPTYMLDPPSIPKFTLKWNAEGGVLNKPTIFGAIGNTLLGGGEAGAEAIAPIGVLQQYIREAVRQETGEIADVISEQFAILIAFLQKNMPQTVFLDSRVLVGELAPGINTYLGKVYNNEMRGNTR